MVQETKTKIIALTLSAWLLLQVACAIPFDGLTAGSPLSVRLLYPFFHAGLFHAGLNMWCFLSIAFILPTKVWQMLTAYAIAVSVPGMLLPAQPLVGLSGVCYALLGLFSFKARHKKKWQLQIWATILIGLPFPNIAVGVHAFCFAVGTLIAALNYPCIQK